MVVPCVWRCLMSEAPRRVQLRRSKGWRMPENTVTVARPGKWGNPWKVGDWFTVQMRGREWRDVGYLDRETAVMFYRLFEVKNLENIGLDVSELRGKNLACWCPLDEPCHADVLLELANA